jgi:hypothetical protein
MYKIDLHIVEQNKNRQRCTVSVHTYTNYGFRVNIHNFGSENSIILRNTSLYYKILMLLHEIMVTQWADCAPDALLSHITASAGRWICPHFQEKCLFRRGTRKILSREGVTIDGVWIGNQIY